MGFQSKTYSLSDEVVAAIEAARARGLTPNKFLLHLLSIERGGALAQDFTEFDERRRGTRQRINQGARRVPVTRSLREKGDGKR